MLLQPKGKHDLGHLKYHILYHFTESGLCYFLCEQTKCNKEQLYALRYNKYLSISTNLMLIFIAITTIIICQSDN